ncbi:MAG: PrsW family intramembrane metalloprotease [Bellilinea sp.]
MGFILSVIFGFAPMLVFALLVYWLDRFEKEPRHLLGGAFVWGAVVAAGFAFFINTLLGTGIFILTGSELIAQQTTGSVIAPLIEEILKGMAVLIVFYFYRKEFDSVLDGIVYAGITALGFAATENTYYIYNYGFLESGYPGLFTLVFIRVILVGWQHPFYTAFFGIGLALARLSSNWFQRLLFPITGLVASILLHSIHNTIPALIPGVAGIVVGTVFDWTGWIGLSIFILYVIYHEKKLIQSELREEVQLGIITLEQYLKSFSIIARLKALVKHLGKPSFRTISHFYQLCAELAHKKHQFQRMGDEGGNLKIIAQLRSELAELSQMMR